MMPVAVKKKVAIRDDDEKSSFDVKSIDVEDLEGVAEDAQDDMFLSEGGQVESNRRLEEESAVSPTPSPTDQDGSFVFKARHKRLTIQIDGRPVEFRDGFFRTKNAELAKRLTAHPSHDVLFYSWDPSDPSRKHLIRGVKLRRLEKMDISEVLGLFSKEQLKSLQMDRTTPVEALRSAVLDYDIEF